jgi:spoIIIJ-associated protein
MDFVEAEGDTIDQAIENALRVLGVGRDKVTVDILEEGTRGFLGIGAKKARIRASLRKAVTLEELHPEERPAFPPPTAEERAELADRARGVLEETLRLMGMEARVEVKEGESPEEVVLNIQGGYGGLLIGRKGQTLEAFEYLLSRIVRGRQGEVAVQFVVDTEGYRERHRQMLQDKALRLGESAKRQRKTIALDNLSARDRRIIHLALQDDPWLTTKSMGQGPYRRLLIIPQGDRKKKEEATSAAAAASKAPK